MIIENNINKKEGESIFSSTAPLSTREDKDVILRNSHPSSVYERVGRLFEVPALNGPAVTAAHFILDEESRTSETAIKVGSRLSKLEMDLKARNSHDLHLDLSGHMSDLASIHDKLLNRKIAQEQPGWSPTRYSFLSDT